MADHTSPNLGTMIAKIRTEIRAAVSVADIKSKIVESKEYNQLLMLSFNERPHSFSTVIGQQAYSNIHQDVLYVDSMSLSLSGRPIELENVDLREIIFDSYINTPSLPMKWAYGGSEWYLWPTPGYVYTIDTWGVDDIDKGLSTNSLNSHTSSWFKEGEKFVRQYAKALIYGELLRNDKEETRSLSLHSKALQELRSKTSKLKGGWQPRPWGL